MSWMPDTPKMLYSWQDAEKSAASWMRVNGYPDARVTTAGADKGIDVLARRAVAQVKMEGRPTGRPALQRLVGAGANLAATQLLFFSVSGFTAGAVAYADDMRMALLVYQAGRWQPANGAARRIVREQSLEAQREKWAARKRARKARRAHAQERARSRGTERAQQEAAAMTQPAQPVARSWTEPRTGGSGRLQNSATQPTDRAATPQPAAASSIGVHIATAAVFLAVAALTGVLGVNFLDSAVLLSIPLFAVAIFASCCGIYGLVTFRPRSKPGVGRGRADGG